MRKVLCLVAAAMLAAVSVAAFSAAAPGPAVVAMVHGGGRADFVPTPHSLNTEGFTDFSIGVTVYEDGTAQGHFLCSVPAIVTISGDILGGSVNDDGSVTVYGLAHGYDHTIPGVFTDLPFTATFRSGGPGGGGFDYRDESGFFAPGQYDTELVRRGMIGIMTDD